uniref:Secreted protein n=1 Tax=Ascaris lumbricoides TaxID=6252 RepID=A0A0M3IRF1_ASCLU
MIAAVFFFLIFTSSKFLSFNGGRNSTRNLVVRVISDIFFTFLERVLKMKVRRLEDLHFV